MLGGGVDSKARDEVLGEERAGFEGFEREEGYGLETSGRLLVVKGGMLCVADGGVLSVKEGLELVAVLNMMCSSSLLESGPRLLTTRMRGRCFLGFEVVDLTSSDMATRGGDQTGGAGVVTGLI